MRSRHVVMLLSNAYGPDVRVQREAEALADAGYKVTIVCWDRQADHTARETISGVDIIRVQDVVTTHGLGWRQVRYFPRFWSRAREIGQELDTNVIHCHDLDTLYAGWQLKKATGAALVFDAHEYYPASISLYLPGLLARLLGLWERWLIRKADVVITASTLLREEYLARGINDVWTVGNYADPERFLAGPTEESRAARQKLGVPEDNLLVSYIGGLHRNRMILPLIEAASSCTDVHVAIWGDGDQRKSVEAASLNHGKVHYCGRASASELPLCFQMSDVIYYGLRLDYPGARYNAPNALGQAMMTSRPVIVTNVGDLGRIVETTGCGILIDEATPGAIEDAIGKLKSSEVRQDLGRKGYEAAHQTYSLEAAKKRLLELYAEISS